MIILRKLNNSFGYIDTDNYGLVMDIHDHLTFYVPNFQFTQAFKQRRWDGKVKLVNSVTHQYPIGLSLYIKKFFSLMGEECSFDSGIEKIFAKSAEETDILEFIKKHKYFVKSKEIFPREDQIRAIVRSIQNNRSVNICPTSFGKSLCIYIQALWNISKGKKTIIVVPTVDLVHQFEADIRDYCTYNGTVTPWFPKIHKIYAGQDKYAPADITISTWQSIYKLEETFINKFDCVVLDECHKSSATCIKKVFDLATDVEIKTGWTGTLNNDSLHQLLAEGLMGPIEEIVDTKTLMDTGIVADMTIALTRLRYPEELSKQVLGLDYQTEIKYIEKNTKRTNTICDLALGMDSTGLMLYKHISHGEKIFETLKKKNPERDVYLIHGGYFYRNDQRFKTIEDMKQFMESDEKAIIVANYQVFSTGLSIKNLHWCCFCSPVKSYVQTIQSIGRGLRISDTKKKLLLIDIIDDFSVKGKKKVKENYAVKHFSVRFSYYMQKQFKYFIKTINI